ncbi:MAG: YkgJ family cysteine cluster protein [Deltaproteobacteria bacterium]|nr:YkgJ family cysteine cluster protein [Deltaproteobacteria bacterium]
MTPNNKVPQTYCLRCGTCCKKGGPALHHEDRVLFDQGLLSWAQVYTLRRGEMVRDLDDRLVPLDQEIIKIKGRDRAWTCLFYEDAHKKCRIYPSRPVECAALKCWDPRPLREAMKRPYLKRLDLLGRNSPLAQVVRAHEGRCSYQAIEGVVKHLESPDACKAANHILELVSYDDFVRSFVIKRLNMDSGATDFLFGRALRVTIRTFGLQVKQEGDTLFLAPRPSHRLDLPRSGRQAGKTSQRGTKTGH